MPAENLRRDGRTARGVAAGSRTGPLGGPALRWGLLVPFDERREPDGGRAARRDRGLLRSSGRKPGTGARKRGSSAGLRAHLAVSCRGAIRTAASTAAGWPGGRYGSGRRSPVVARFGLQAPDLYPPAHAGRRSGRAGRMAVALVANRRGQIE